jgi:serine/threonine-protein kinase
MVAYQLQAWMPEAVATFKVRGFVQDVGGEVIESLPGRVRVRLGKAGGRYALPKSRLSWLGLGGRDGIEMELQLTQSTGTKHSTVWVTAIFRYVGKGLDRNWRSRCDQIYRDLRGYLIGSSIEVRR